MTIPPRVMRVLLALVDARGLVVTRDELADRCWQGRFVAEDSLNGTIAELRKALRAVCANDVRVETVPKTGYWLSSPISVEQSARTTPSDRSAGVEPTKVLLNRRLLIAVSSAAAVAAMGGAWWLSSGPADAEVTLLVEQGARALREGLPESGTVAVALFSRALQRDPGSAKAWGMLALAWRATAEYGDPENIAKARANAETAAKRALALDNNQSDALTALATLTPAFGDWIDAERRIRKVLAVDPANGFAVAALATILMSTGQVQACLERLDWLQQEYPLSPDLQFRRIYTLWSAGHLADMDRTADRALQAWPLHPAVWFARLWTLAFTGRTAAALAMLVDAAARPAMPLQALDILSTSMRALATNAADDVRAAVSANLTAASRGPGQATCAIMVLSQLKASESAFEVAQGHFVRQGPVVVQSRHTLAQTSLTDQYHRMTMVLWIPATEALRLHPDFRSLCDHIGMVDYWRATGTRPEFNKGSLAIV